MERQEAPRDALPKAINKTLAEGAALIKDAKGLGG
jgi:hypothetical protein